MTAMLSSSPVLIRRSALRHTRVTSGVLAGVIALHVCVAVLLVNQPPSLKIKPPLQPVAPIAIRWVSPVPAPARPAPAPVQPPQPVLRKTVPVLPQKPPVALPTPIARPTATTKATTKTATLTTTAKVTPTSTAAPADAPNTATAAVLAAPQPSLSATPKASVAEPVTAQPASTPAPAVTRPDSPKTVQGVAYRHAPELIYPESARDRGEQGRVLVLVLIDTEGRVNDAKIQRSSGSRLLDQAALSMAKKTTFHPYRENGVAQSVYVPIPLEFKLDEE